MKFRSKSTDIDIHTPYPSSARVVPNLNGTDHNHCWEYSWDGYYSWELSQYLWVEDSSYWSMTATRRFYAFLRSGKWCPTSASHWDRYWAGSYHLLQSTENTFLCAELSRHLEWRDWGGMLLWAHLGLPLKAQTLTTLTPALDILPRV